MAQMEGWWPPQSGRYWRTPETAGESLHGWRQCHQSQSHCSAGKEMQALN